MAGDIKEGRPLKFQSVEEFETKAADYFNTVNREEWTITGLALHLDTFRNVLMDYQEKDEFSNAVKRAKAMIEHAYELRGMNKATAFDIFRLKNMGWKDKTETDITSNGETVGVTDPLLAAKFNDFMSQDTKD